VTSSSLLSHVLFDGTSLSPRDQNGGRGHSKGVDTNVGVRQDFRLEFHADGRADVVVGRLQILSSQATEHF
jgi:hypothetical protein